MLARCRERPHKAFALGLHFSGALFWRKGIKAFLGHSEKIAQLIGQYHSP